MGTNSALMASRVIENSFQVLSIQFMALLQGIDYLEISDKISIESKKIYRELREIFPLFTEDTPLCGDIERITDYLKNN
jgi:histidine ammonia-lyase